MESLLTSRGYSEKNRLALLDQKKSSMSTIHNVSNQHRSSPPHLKKTVFRTTRGGLSRGLSGPKLGKASKPDHKFSEEGFAGTDDEGMATSFLQFCAYCEKQIVVPNNSILYCSESCGRRDGIAPPTIIHMSSLTSKASFPNFSIPTSPVIISKRKPSTFPQSCSIPPVLHSFKPSLDPTEWKPNLRGATAPEPPPEDMHKHDSRPSLNFPDLDMEHDDGSELVRPPSSEAFNYLSQFHRTSSTLGSGVRRPRVAKRSSTSAVHFFGYMAPSLSHTPATSSTSADSSGVGTPEEYPKLEGLNSPTSPVNLLGSYVVRGRKVDISNRKGSPTTAQSMPITDLAKGKDSRGEEPLSSNAFEKKHVRGDLENLGQKLNALLVVEEITAVEM